ncbi:hypothetical protein [Rhizobium rhizogenes]|jgi:hypothetical protein|uniref:hypothetical protein n=1 Tax=Rhizobium rhizogenes TaxID=359 RepID=UPI001574D682|nr:hypothetical protein [Rhizobium rhizogenes]NTI29259.1 hypothetical protein [Rhizobium rhizogenes]
MTEVEMLTMEREAYKSWLIFFMTHIAAGRTVLPEDIAKHLTDYRYPGNPAYPIHDEIANAITERFVEYVRSQDPKDLRLPD